MQVGELLEAPDTGDTAAFAAAVRSAILNLLRVNPSHLLAVYLSAGPLDFSTHEFGDWLRRTLELSAQRGLKLDPRFAEHASDAALEKRLHWLRRKRLLRFERGRWQNLWPRNTPAGWQTPAQQVAYCANTFDELLPGFARRLWP